MGFQHRPETRMDTHSRLLHLLKYPQNYPQKNLLNLASSLPPDDYANNPAQGTRRPRPQANRVTDLPSRAGARGRKQIRKCPQAEAAPEEGERAQPKASYKGRADYMRMRYNITRRCAVATVSIFKVKSYTDIPQPRFYTPPIEKMLCAKLGEIYGLHAKGPRLLGTPRPCRNFLSCNFWARVAGARSARNKPGRGPARWCRSSALGDRYCTSTT